MTILFDKIKANSLILNNSCEYSELLSLKNRTKTEIFMKFEI